MSVVIATLNPGQVDVSYNDSLVNTLAYDRQHGLIRSTMSKVPGAGDLDGARNWAARTFLDHYPDADWLMMVDADMGWPPDAIHRLVHAADPEQRPVVGGLAFGSRPSGQHGWGQATFDMFPTLYRNTDGVYRQQHTYPANTLLQVNGTGAAFLLVHRTVFETLAETWGDHWFDRVVWNKRRYSEDLSFCLKLEAADIPLYVHTGVETTHTKPILLDSYLYRHMPSPPNIVVVPVKDRLDLTKTLVEQLETQPIDGLFLYDNGSTDGTAEWADQLGHVHRIEADGWDLGAMWNDGIERALAVSKRANVFILNNDIQVDDRFIVEMASGLRDSGFVAVSPNYDRRPRDRRFAPLSGICAGRYDGTGGLAGFAFAVKGEWFANGWRFPDGWHFGDTDLAVSIEAAGLTHGMVLDAQCVHVDGGSQTGNWDSPEWQEQIAADQQAFLDRWPQIQLQSA